MQGEGIKGKMSIEKEKVLPATHCWECGEKLANPTQIPPCSWCGKARHCGLNPDCTMEHHQAVECEKRKKYLCCYKEKTAPAEDPGCPKPLIRDQEGCWECGHKCKPTIQHKRCQDWWLCPDCWDDHIPYCEANLPHRGKLEAVKTLGSGSQCVYVYYGEAEYELAQFKAKTVWMHKIGLASDGDFTKRIRQQGTKTALSANPIVPLVFLTEDAARLERLLHVALTYAGRHHHVAPGAEWFETNPDEVERLYVSFEAMRQSLQREV